MSEAREAKTDALFGFVLFVVALLPRLYVALAWSGEPVWDGHYYDFAARRIAEGFGYSDDLVVDGHTIWHAWCHYPVGYSAALAIFYKVLGTSHGVAAVFDSLTGAALAVVTWLVAREGMSSVRARIAGGIVALHPGLILYAALVMTEPLSALLTFLSFWIAVRGRRLRDVLGGAVVLGLAALVRPQALLCAPFLAWLALAPRPSPPPGRGEDAEANANANANGDVRTANANSTSPALGRGAGGVGSSPRANASPRRNPTAVTKRAFAVASAIAFATLLPILPWTARNCRVMDGCALISTNGGWNLAIGAFPRATGRFETLHASDGCREVTGQVQQDRCWFAYGVHEILAHPGHWLSLVPAKLGFTFDHESFEVEYLHEARPEDWPEARRAFGRDVTTFAHRLLLCAAALGCVAWARQGRRGRGQGRQRRPSPRWEAAQDVVLLVILALAVLAVTAEAPTFWPLAVAMAVLPWLPIPGSPPWPWALRLPLALFTTTVLTHVVFFGEDRYHVVLIPVLALLAAGAFRRPTAAPAQPQ